jgi:alkyl hydroperoxide reductase subunit AhpF
VDDLQLSATSGGAAVAITAIGAGMLQKLVVETFGGQGTHTITACTMSLD